MAKSGPNLDFQPAHFKQVYFAIPTDVHTAFKTRCVADKLAMKDALHKLVLEYVNGKVKIK